MNDESRKNETPPENDFESEDIDIEAIDDFPSEDWDDDFDDIEAETVPLEPVKKRSGLGGKKLYLALGFIIAVGAAYMLIGPGSTPAPDPASTSTVSGMMSDAPDINSIATQGDMPPMPAPISADAPSSTAGEVSVIEDPALEVAKIPAIPPDRTLSNVEMDRVEDSMEAPAAEVDIDGLLAKAEKEASEKMGALGEEWEQKYNVLKSEMADKLKAAEAKLGAAEQSSQKSAPALEKLNAENAALKEQVKSLMTDKQKAETALAALKAEAAKTPQAAAEIPWVLRSAQNGKALISQKGSDVMQSVKTGDLVPGLGKITEISLQDGAWVIEGTEGTLRR